MTAKNDQKVAISYLHPGTNEHCFTNSLANLLVHDMQNHRRIVNGGAHAPVQSPANINNARNLQARAFQTQLQADWLWLVDSDMDFPPDIVDRLVDAAHPETRPIVGGLYFGVSNNQPVPVLYGLTDEQPAQVVRYADYPRDALFRVLACGTGCLLIHRSVIAALAERHPEPWPWFAESVYGAQPIGEDITFCLRAGAAGFPVHVDTSIKLRHAKTFLVDEEMYLASRAPVVVERPALVAANGSPLR